MTGVFEIGIFDLTEEMEEAERKKTEVLRVKLVVSTLVGLPFMLCT